MKAVLIPQFSIRWLLAVTAVCAVIFSIVGLGVRGSAWAAAVSIGIGSLVILMLIYGLLFAVVWVFSLTTRSLGRSRGRAAGSPFKSESAGSGPAASPEGAPAAPVLAGQSPFASEES